MLSSETKYFLKQVFKQVYQTVKPKELIPSQLKVSGNKLIVNGEQYVLNHNCYVVGFGKAVYDMGCEVHALLQNHIRRAVFSVPEGSITVNNKLLTGRNIEVFEGAKDNIPDRSSYVATKKILELVDGLTKEDLLLVLISGGGSALLVSPVEEVSLEEKISLTRALGRSGADIQELNAVRTCLSEVKGGRLAVRAYPSSVLTLILSDVVGDPLEVIASGPTVPFDPIPPLPILEKYSLTSSLSPSIIRVLSKPQPLSDPLFFKNIRNVVIGNNSKALSAGKSVIDRNNQASCILTTRIQGRVDIISNVLVQFIYHTCRLYLKKTSAIEYKSSISNHIKTLCISEENISECISIVLNNSRDIFFLLGGETTVQVKGNGKGGRNMELALRFSYELNKMLEGDNELKSLEIGFLSGGTDGIDGPTDAAGAIAYPEQVELAKQQGLDLVQYIQNNDSYHFFKSLNSGEDLIVTGHTGTNVMDVIIIYIKKKTP